MKQNPPIISCSKLQTYTEMNSRVTRARSFPPLIGIRQLSSQDAEPQGTLAPTRLLRATGLTGSPCPSPRSEAREYRPAPGTQRMRLWNLKRC